MSCLLHFFAVLDHVSKNKRNDSVHLLSEDRFVVVVVVVVVVVGFYEWKYTCFTSSKPLCVKQKIKKRTHFSKLISPK